MEAAFDIEIRRAPPRRAGRASYLPPSDCQIPSLGWLYEHFLGWRDHGFFVDVGAYDGVAHSNTSCLAEAGWAGIMVEPVPAYAEMCRANHAGRNVTVVQAAVGSEPGRTTLVLAGTLTTSDPSQYEGVPWAEPHLRGESLEVEVTTLDLLLQRHGVEHIDVLSVDVEGSERDVFDGFDLARWMPKMVIVELTDVHPDLTRARDAELQDSICAEGYRVIFKDSINTVFLRR